MMTNLFSIFDPSSSFMNLNFLVFFIFMFLPINFYLLSFYSFDVFYFLSFIKKEINYLMFYPKKGLYLFMSSIFILLFFMNFFSLFPFIFSITSHLYFNMPLSYCFWFSIIIFCWFKFFSDFLNHLIPFGVPFPLISFMVIVEFFSNIIRPLALTFRLTANMMAGHLLMSLIGGFLLSLPFFSMLFFSFFQSLLVFMEMGVSFIQAYVFFTLLMLYTSEVYKS